jgi:hypothetical protein
LSLGSRPAWGETRDGRAPAYRDSNWRERTHPGQPYRVMSDLLRDAYIRSNGDAVGSARPRVAGATPLRMTAHRRWFSRWVVALFSWSWGHPTIPRSVE